jgi:hypothetical protein
MTDREMLELAALAADHDYRPKYGVIVTDGIPGNWNPLADDGDALCLAVHLGILLRTDFIRLLGDLLGSGADHRYATRLAIVRIAAEIGQLKKENSND